MKKPESSLIVRTPDKKFAMKRSAGRTDQEPSFDRGNGKYRERTPCNSPLSTKAASCSGFEGDYDKSNDIGEASTRGMSFMKGHISRRSSLRTRRSNLHHLKPLSSLDSCLMAQLYKEHAEMEDVLAPLPSPCTPALRPFLVSDGTQIISQSSYDSFNIQFRDGKGKSHIKVHPEANETISCGIPRLPEIRSDEGSKEKNPKRRKGQNINLTNTKRMHNEMQASSQGSGAVIFCLGVSVGIISSILANKAEVAKLHDLLKNTENLVQDLHEELEMKDSVIVKELVKEDDTSSNANENSANKLKPNETLVHTDSEILIKYGDEATGALKAAETVESMSTIEAELEAELERLELNMKESTLNGSLSEDDEFDPDFLVQGELRADMLSNKPSSDPSLDHNSSNSSTPSHTPKQGVSPHELSLRLHQLIQSRLEQRITDLESALEESDKRISQLQSEQQLSCSWRGFSHTDVSSSSFSTRDSPNTVGGSTPVEFYYGAFQEIKKSNGSNIEIRNGTGNGSGPKTPMSSSTMIEESEKLCVNENEDEEEDEDMRMLIKQLVEKTRQGSPAVLHAHRALVYLDKNEE